MAKWSVNEAGADGPAAFLNLLSRMAPEAQQAHPKLGFLDALYRHTRLIEANKHMAESKR